MTDKLAFLETDIPKEDRPLSALQIRFVEEMILDPSNVTKAAKRAGYSISTANEAGGRLMMDSRVKKMISTAQDTRAKAIGISSERILQELAKIAFAEAGAEIRLTEDGDLDMQSLKNQIGEVIVSAQTGRNKSKATSFKTVKIADKVSALVKLGQHLGMFKQEVEVSGKLSLEKLIEDSFSTEETEATQPAE